MQRMIIVRQALAAAVAGLAPATAAPADYAGRYVGVIACDTLPGITAQRLQTEFTMTVAEGQAEYQRDLLQPDGSGRMGVTERGAGSVSSGGEVTLLGSAAAPTWRYEATYRGRFDGPKLRLTGAQVWQFAGRGPHTRPCTIDGSRSQ